MKKISHLAVPYVVWTILLLALPMVLIVFYSVVGEGNTILDVSFTIDNYKKFFTDKDFLIVLWRSVKIALETTVICILVGYPIAYFISRSEEKYRNLFILLVTIPMWINMLVRTYAWIGILSENGVANKILSFIGLGDVQLIHTQGAVILGMVYNFIPFMILQINSSLSKMDNSLLEASQDLGADGKTTFMKIVLPLSLPGVVSGIALVFLPSVSSFFIPKMLGGGQFFLIGNVIENQFITVGEWSFGSAISVIMAALMMLSMYVVRAIEKKNKVDRGDD